MHLFVFVGGQELVGAILAAEVVDDGVKTFFAHPGTTFGGLTVISSVLKPHEMNSILEAVEDFLRENGFEKIYLKLVPSIYSKIPTDLIDYLLSYRNYSCNSELNFVLDLPRDIDPIEIFSAEKRRDTRYSMKNNLEFCELDQIHGGGGQLESFYQILQKNLEEHKTRPVHSIDELRNLTERFPNEIKFYGVFSDEKMIAGSMVFIFDSRIFHTQYLASVNSERDKYPMNFLIYNLIKTSIDLGCQKFSFGISTEKRGRILNFGLARFKEGFCARAVVNRSYERRL